MSLRQKKTAKRLFMYKEIFPGKPKFELNVSLLVADLKRKMFIEGCIAGYEKGIHDGYKQGKKVMIEQKYITANVSETAKEQAKSLSKILTETAISGQSIHEVQWALWSEIERDCNGDCAAACMDAIYRYGYMEGAKTKKRRQQNKLE